MGARGGLLFANILCAIGASIYLGGVIVTTALPEVHQIIASSHGLVIVVIGALLRIDNAIRSV